MLAILTEEITPADAIDAEALQRAIQGACGSIMPAWPLDQAVATNPHWRRIGMPIRTVAARLAVLGDFHVFPSRSTIRGEWEAGRITPADLEAALEVHAAQGPLAITADDCVAALQHAPHLRREPLLVDLLDDKVQKNKRWPWRAGIVFQMSQTCATYFDRHQADWRAAGDPSLYGFWHDTLLGDLGLASMFGLPGFHKLLHVLPRNPEEAARWALGELGLPLALWEDYFKALLLSINGWASWCAYIGWQKIPAGQDDARLPELLTARLAWEALLACAAGPEARHGAIRALAANWADFGQRVAEAEAALEADEVWQQALEASYQRGFAAKLRSTVPAPVTEAPEAQAVFCIDTRSELMRRALEAITPTVETRAFAGFFGIPIHYKPLGTRVHRPQLPGLAYPSVAVQDVVTETGQAAPAADTLAGQMRDARWKRLAQLDQWLGTVRWSNSTFSFVEALGVGYLGKIVHWIRPPAAARVSDDRIGLPAAVAEQCRPMIVGLDLEAQVDLAAGVLHTLGLDDRLAPLVVFCGHSGQCTNNAHASTLDCGACYGRPGEANARALAHLLNDSAVRAGLRGRGLNIPEATFFMGALHNTTTDEVTGFDLDLLPPAAWPRWRRMEGWFAEAGKRIRRERAPALWIDPEQSDETLLRTFRRRANDGAQTRPEWGLTRNAAFIIGPRQRSRGRQLNRTYLHDYDARYDPDGSVLEKLMMGPMLVCHWLSWQYHASTCDPLHYGAGNKVLHNVVDGHVGVFEGNGGDLRIGLPKQSLHNGDGWYHQPVRLTVVIDAPAESIAAIIGRNPVLGRILDNGWMLLWRYGRDALQRYDAGRWLPLAV
ncbi:MAG: DUF2309 domain-containing protein [Burkholderiaceae bacterium]|nr:MAG: DUF2309 domain-containing protein [Burkholderiaceae bacterium]